MQTPSYDFTRPQHSVYRTARATQSNHLSGHLRWLYRRRGLARHLLCCLLVAALRHLHSHSIFFCRLLGIANAAQSVLHLAQAVTLCVETPCEKPVWWRRKRVALRLGVCLGSGAASNVKALFTNVFRGVGAYLEPI